MATILLVEDVAIVRDILRRFVESGGHQVTECDNGEDAARLVAERDFDVVITDLWMKNGDGVAFISAQSQKDFPPRIVAMTGGDPHVSGHKSLELARKAGALRVLTKPVTKSEILEAIDFALQAA